VVLITLINLQPFYTCRRKVNRWPMVLFCNVIDVAAIPASIVWLCENPERKESEGKRRRAMFLRELGYSLIMPHMELRSSIPTLQRPVRQAMQTFGIRRRLPSTTRSSPASYKKRRCNLSSWRGQKSCKSMFLLFEVSLSCTQSAADYIR